MINKDQYFLNFLISIEKCLKFGEVHGGKVEEYSTAFYTNKQFFIRLQRALFRRAIVKDKEIIHIITIFGNSLKKYIKNNY